jgi:hypothetical protein
MLDNEQAEKDYVPYVVNRCLSYFIDTIIHANQMNHFPLADKKMQFDYYLNVIRKRKRYSKWVKKETSENFNTVKEYYDYSDSKTKEIIDILQPDDIVKMKEYMSDGGIKK